jgi:hypothetical protein
MGPHTVINTQTETELEKKAMDLAKFTTEENFNPLLKIKCT